MSEAISVTGDSVLRLARGVKMRQDDVRQRTVLLAPERTVALDETGIAILSRLNGEASLDTIAAGLARSYNAPHSVILKDATTFLQDLADRRFLEAVT
ncbi:MAG: pyrroloquinoline quinone biosynthesis peptide chaperone PqqD [Ahrensia sp.]|nr:pyrroloquinoline quinone biosynthesis peptide chaperone PqqD [Ahrensia sp.]